MLSTSKHRAVVLSTKGGTPSPTKNITWSKTNHAFAVYSLILCSYVRYLKNHHHTWHAPMMHYRCLSIPNPYSLRFSDAASDVGDSNICNQHLPWGPYQLDHLTSHPWVTPEADAEASGSHWLVEFPGAAGFEMVNVNQPTIINMVMGCYGSMWTNRSCLKHGYGSMWTNQQFVVVHIPVKTSCVI